MIIDKHHVRRLGIYFFYDLQGIVDGYVDFFLKEYAKCFERLIVVCNGKLSEKGYHIFEKYTDEILVRENEGLDVWAYKTAFESVGWEELSLFDEVTIANSTSMGPVYPLMDMYQDMAEKDLDFWGIAKHFYYKDDVFGNIPYGYIPEHIQSYYMVFRKSLVSTEKFQKYWDNMPMIKSYQDSIALFEVVFTKKFEDFGFKWDVYVDTEDLKPLTLHPILAYPVELIKNRKCPIFKRRSFFQDYNVMLDSSLGQEGRELYEYLRDSLLYDTNLIWDNLLRTCHQEDFVKTLHLNYILSCENLNEKRMQTQYAKKKIALLMHLYFVDLLDTSYLYACSVPEFTDVYITTDTEEKRKLILEKFRTLLCHKLEVRVIPNRGRDVASILIGLRDVIPDYEIACFYHDKKAGQVFPGSVGESFGYKCSQNVLYNKPFVYRILETFDRNPRLGLLSPPEPNHGDFFTTLGFEWCWNYEITKDLAEKLEINVPMSPDKAPVAPLGSVFWFRVDAMRKLNEYSWKYEDFPEEPLPVNGTISHAIERIRPFVVQQAGYYPAYVMAAPYAEIEITNLRQYVKNYNQVLMNNGFLTGTQRSILVNLDAACKNKRKMPEQLPWYMKMNNILKRIFPQNFYNTLIRWKRTIFGPRNLV